jgi:hypothetical protein
MIRSEATNRAALHRVVGRVLAVAAIVGITMLGNLRLHASETGKVDRRVSPRVPVSWADDSNEYGRPALRATAAVDPGLAPMVDTNDDVEASNDIQLVPAIYAWNPDVRFVYFRHVSKWM